MSAHNLETTRGPELVVTIPARLGKAVASEAEARTTLGVITELIVSARRELILGAPFIQGNEALHSGPIDMALLAAIARGVNVDLLCTAASASQLAMERLRGAGHGRVRVFQPTDNIADSRTLGSHAKMCISDGERMYIGSANLTQKGITDQLEIGVLLHGPLARQTSLLVRRLLDSTYFTQTKY